VRGSAISVSTLRSFGPSPWSKCVGKLVDREYALITKSGAFAYRHIGQ